MTEILFFLGLAGPFALMIWLTMARRRAQRIVSEYEPEEDTPPFSKEGFTEELTRDGDLTCGRSYDGDGKVVPPDDPSGEFGGIKALQGRR